MGKKSFTIFDIFHVWIKIFIRIHEQYLIVIVTLFLTLLILIIIFVGY